MAEHYGDRLGRLEGIVEQISDYGDRLGRLEGIVEQISDRLGKLEGRISSLESSHRRDFRWLVGAILGMWATMMGLLLTVTVKVFAG